MLLIETGKGAPFFTGLMKKSVRKSVAGKKIAREGKVGQFLTWCGVVFFTLASPGMTEDLLT